MRLAPEAPKGKLPYIEDGDEVMANSGFIVLHLKTKYKDLNAGLNPAELALSLAMQRLLEEASTLGHPIFVMAVHRRKLVTSCPAPQKPHAPPRLTAGFRLNGPFFS